MTIKTSLQNQAYQSIRQQIIYADLEPGKKSIRKKIGRNAFYRSYSNT